MRNCPACGAELDVEGARYCPQCGSRIDEGEAGAPQGTVCPVRLEINDNHFYMANRAGVLDFRLHSRVDEPITGLVLTVESAYLGSRRECRLDLPPHQSRRERVQVTPSVSGEHLIDLTVRLEVEGGPQAFRAQPILKVLDEDVAPGDLKVVIDQSMHVAGEGRLGFGQTVQNEVKQGFAKGLIRSVNDLLTQRFADHWEEVPLEPMPEVAEVGPSVRGAATEPPAPTGAAVQAPSIAPAGGLPEPVLAPEQIEAARSAGIPPAIEVDLGSGVTMKMVFIPPGEFLMGSPESEQDRQEHEGPQHRVRITKGFYVGMTQVTQGQWQAVMGTAPWEGHTFDPSNPEHAATHISWNDCQAFLDAVNAASAGGFALPTEAQWAYACRAGSTTRFSYGDDPDYSELRQYGWYYANTWDVGEGYPHAVGRKKPNAWGLYDIHGNVWEWCTDWFRDYTGGGETDPMGPASGTSRVLRGGSWGSVPIDCRSAKRLRYNPTLGTSYGFRVARTVLPSAP